MAARFPGVERGEMERIARWARRSPKSALGAWPDAQLQNMQTEGRRDLLKAPLCSCAADVEAIYLTLLDHHVLELVRTATPESFTERVIRFHAHGARGEESAWADPETSWCLQSESTDAGHWEALWKQYRKANGAKIADAMTLATKLRHRALATQRSTSKGRQEVGADHPATSLRAASPGGDAACNGCVDAEFCKLGASDLMKRVALDLRMMVLSFNIEAVLHGRTNHHKHLLIVHRILAAYEADAQAKLQDTLAGAIYYPPIVSSTCWEPPSASTRPLSPSTERESAGRSNESQATRLPKTSSVGSSVHEQWIDNSKPSPESHGAKSPPVSPPPDGSGATVESESDIAATLAANCECTRERTQPDDMEEPEEAEKARPCTDLASNGLDADQTSQPAVTVSSDASLTVKAAQLQAAAMSSIHLRPKPVEAASAAARVRLTKPLSSFGAANSRPAGPSRDQPSLPTSNSPPDTVEEYRSAAQRHRDHRWGAKKIERQNTQAWLEKHSSKRTRQPRDIGMLTKTSTPIAQASQRSSPSCRLKQASVAIPAFRQDRSRWGVLRTQSKLARQRDFVAGNQRMIEKSLSTSAI